MGYIDVAALKKQWEAGTADPVRELLSLYIESLQADTCASPLATVIRTILFMIS